MATKKKATKKKATMGTVPDCHYKLVKPKALNTQQVRDVKAGRYFFCDEISIAGVLVMTTSQSRRGESIAVCVETGQSCFLDPNWDVTFPTRVYIQVNEIG